MIFTAFCRNCRKKDGRNEDKMKRNTSHTIKRAQRFSCYIDRGRTSRRSCRRVDRAPLQNRAYLCGKNGLVKRWRL